MTGQTTLTAYPLGGQWADEHPAAADFCEAVARKANAEGRAASFRDECLPGLRANAYRYGLTRKPEAQYAVDHNLCSSISRFLMETRGVRFTVRKSSLDGATHATPRIEVAR